MDMTLAGWIALAAAAFLVGLAKCGVPGAGILAVPLVAAAFPARASTGLLLPLLIVGDTLALIRYRRHADVRRLFLLMPAAVVGVGIGYFLMGRITDAQLRPFIGAIILLLMMMAELRKRMSSATAGAPGRKLPVAVPAGLAAGVLTMMANAAGPVMNLYLLAMRLPKEVFIGTGAWYFFSINCFKIPFSAHLGLITRASLRMDLWLAPAVVLGAFAGGWVLRRIPQTRFEQLVKVLTVVAALRLLLAR